MASSANNALAQQQSSLATSSSSNNNNNTTSSLSGHVTPTSAMFNNGGGGLGQVGGIGSDRGQQQQQMPIGGPNNPQGSVGQQNSSSLLGYRSFTNFSQVNARTSSMVRRSVLISRRSPSPEWPTITESLLPLFPLTAEQFQHEQKYIEPDDGSLWPGGRWWFGRPAELPVGVWWDRRWVAIIHYSPH